MSPATSHAPVVAGLGAVAVDQLIYVDEPYSIGKGRVVARQTSYGGNAGTGLAAAAKLGAHATFIGYLPDPTAWSDVYADLESHGVDVTNARPVDGADPIQATILLTPDGERFVAFDDDTPIGAPADLGLDLVTSADVLLIDAYGAVEGLRAVRAARAAGVPVVADLERPGAPGVDRLLEEVDHLVIPVAFALAATGTLSPAAAIDRLWNNNRTAVVVTDGANGSWYRTKDNPDIAHTPAFDVVVVDTNGCGDVYHGVYAVSIARGMSVPHAILRAAAGAAVCATAAGGRGHLPSEDDIVTLIASARPQQHCVESTR